MEAKTIIKRMSEEESNWFREFSRDTAMRDYNESMSIAKKEGLAQGLAEGLAQGMAQGLAEGERKKTVEIARSLSANGVSIDIIAKSLNMTIEEATEIVCDAKKA